MSKCILHNCLGGLDPGLLLQDLVAIERHRVMEPNAWGSANAKTSVNVTGTFIVWVVVVVCCK